MRWTAVLVFCLATSRVGMAVDSDAYWDREIGRVQLGGPPGHGFRVLSVHQGAVYGAGWFTSVDGHPSTNVAKWDGTRWWPMPGLGSGPDHHVTAMASHRGWLYAAGVLGRGGPGRPGNVAGWNGLRWRTLGQGMDGLVHTLASWQGRLVAGGRFDRAGRNRASNLAAWDGREWSPLGGGVSGTNAACADCDGTSEAGRVRVVYADGARLWVGGAFQRAGDVAARNIAVWDGTDWAAVGEGLPGEVHQIIVVGDKTYAGGDFRRGGRTIGLMEWDGRSWQPVGTGVTEPYGTVLALATDGHLLYVGGNFRRIGGVTAPGLARWDGTRWEALGSGVAGDYVGSLVTAGNALYLGGGFVEAGSHPANSVACWHFPGTLRVATRGSEVVISWPRADERCLLEVAEERAGTGWKRVEQCAALEGDRWTVIEPLSDGGRMYRLIAP